MKHKKGDEVLYNGYDFPAYRGDYATIKDCFDVCGHNMCIVEFTDRENSKFFEMIDNENLKNSSYFKKDFKDNKNLYMLLESMILKKPEYFQAVLDDKVGEAAEYD